MSGSAIASDHARNRLEDPLSSDAAATDADAAALFE